MDDGILWILAHFSNLELHMDNDIIKATESWQFSVFGSGEKCTDFTKKLKAFLRICLMVLFPHENFRYNVIVSSSVAGILNVSMLRSFHEHGIKDDPLPSSHVQSFSTICP